MPLKRPQHTSKASAHCQQRFSETLIAQIPPIKQEQRGCPRCVQRSLGQKKPTMPKADGHTRLLRLSSKMWCQRRERHSADTSEKSLSSYPVCLAN